MQSNDLALFDKNIFQKKEKEKKTPKEKRGNCRRIVGQGTLTERKGSVQ